MVIRIPERKEKMRGIVKYSQVPSESKPGVIYTVTKFRRKSRGTHGYNKYTYACSCPDWIFRQRTCKHITMFHAQERG